MDIVDFWSKQIAKWKEEDKCGMCWEFSAPLFENATNIQQNEEACCTYVFLTELKTRKNFKKYDGYGQTGYSFIESCDYSFTVHFVRQGDLGTNNYNEIKGHPIDEGRYNTIYKPITDCLDCDLELDFCEFVGEQVDNLTWVQSMEQAYLDNNYFGWRLNITFRLPR